MIDEFVAGLSTLHVLAGAADALARLSRYELEPRQFSLDRRPGPMEFGL